MRTNLATKKNDKQPSDGWSRFKGLNNSDRILKYKTVGRRMMKIKGRRFIACQRNRRLAA